MTETLRYDQLSETLQRLGFSQDAAEYHGALCGTLCVRHPRDVDPMQLLEGAAPPAAPDGAGAAQALRQLCGQSAEALESSEMVFAPLLPDDEEDLPLRVRALSSWCEGFLYGLTTGAPLDMGQCSPEMKEILKDFTEFTRAGIDDDSDSDVEETAYAELVEYIRVGAQLIYMELHEHDPARSKTLH